MSKYRLIQIFAVLTIAVFAFSGCKGDDDDNPAGPGGNGGSNSITINGGGFNNSTIDFAASYGGYAPNEGYTAIVMSSISTTDTVYVYVAFNGASTGTKAWEAYDPQAQGFSGVMIQTGTGENTKFYVPVSGTIQVSAYGNVGQKITGTYTGTAAEMTTLQQVTVSGKFDATRVPDGD